MRTEARFALAVLLMLLVLIGTNRLFPPIVPEQDVAGSGLGGDSLGGATDGVPGADPVPSSGVPTAAAPVVPADPSAGGEPRAPETTAGPPVREVVVESPLYRFTFSTAGARLVSGRLPQFNALNREGVVELVPDGVEGIFGQRILVGSDTVDLSSVPFSVEPEAGLRLDAGDGERSLTFTYRHPTADFELEVEYAFAPDRYIVGVRGRTQGVRSAILVTDLGAGLAFAEADSAQEARLMAYVYNHVQNGIRSEGLAGADPALVPGPLIWAAFKNKFFVTALMAGESEETVDEQTYLTALFVRDSEMPERVRMGAAQRVSNDGRFAYRLFLGPQEYARLSTLGQDMEEVNPYGWRFFRPMIRPFVSIIMTILEFLHAQLAIGYGWVLVIFGVLMRIVLFPLNHKAMKAQLRNMAVQPLVQEIQKRYKDTPEKLQKEMMRLHKEHGFNPLAGCLPMLLPWPVLIALFFVFQNTIELRGVPFLWLPDLSAKDPFYALPILLALSMFLMQWVSLRSLDSPNPQMKMMMYIMPPMMLFIFANLASGLNLYYATANLATIPQQVWIANERKKMQGKPPPKLSTE